MKYTKTNYQNIFIGEDYEIYKFLKNGTYHKLSKWIDNVGYYMVSFQINKVRKYVRVHRILAETLISNPNNWNQVNHIDGNKLNNAINNLEWTTNSQNTKHAYNNGLYHSIKRSHKIKAKNKITGIETIYNSIRSCSEILGLNRKTITGILKGTKITNNYQYDFEYV